MPEELLLPKPQNQTIRSRSQSLAQALILQGRYTDVVDRSPGHPLQRCALGRKTVDSKPVMS